MNRVTPWVLAASIGSLWLGGCGTAPAPQPTPKANSSKPTTQPKPTAKTQVSGAKTTQKLKVIAFYDQTMSAVSPDPFTLLKAHPGLVDYLSPFWYEVSSTGSIISKPQGNAAALAQQDHLPLMPLVTNAAGTDGFLHTASARASAIGQIVNLVKTHHYVGVNIDFQMLKSTDRTDLTTFMDSLYKAMPKTDVISMSIVPLTSLNGQSSAYDYAALDKVVGSMVLMAYDFHGNGTSPGPVSPYGWVAKSITSAIKAGVKPAKIYLGIADYGYLWTQGSTKATTIPLKVMYQHKYGAYTWSPTYKEAYDKYTSGGVSHIIWFVNDRAAKDRINLAEKYHLGGVAFWRIGYEDAKWWNTVAKAIQSSPTSKTAGSKTGIKHKTPIAPKAPGKPGTKSPKGTKAK